MACCCSTTMVDSALLSIAAATSFFGGTTGLFGGTGGGVPRAIPPKAEVRGAPGFLIVAVFMTAGGVPVVVMVVAVAVLGALVNAGTGAGRFSCNACGNATWSLNTRFHNGGFYKRLIFLQV